MKRNWLNLLYSLSLIVVGLCFASCNSDNEEFLSISDDKETLPLEVNIQLFNKEGTETNTFVEGENFVLKMTIRNTGAENVLIDRFRYISGQDRFFCTYTNNGKEIGTPWDEAWGDEVNRPNYTLKPNGIIILHCVWPANQNYQSLITWTQEPNLVIKNIKPLSRGEYYILFDIKLTDSIVVKCEKSFKIE